MRLSQNPIQTLREAPSNARSEGFAWLVRARVISRANDLLPLGQRTTGRLHALAATAGGSIFTQINLPVITSGAEIFFALQTGATGIMQCPSCGYAARRWVARFAKSALPPEDPLPTEKIATPDCNTIEELANFLGIPQEKTAKALMFTRQADGKFIFAVVRGDMQLSETKLAQLVGDVRPATTEEIEASGAAAGYASPVGLKEAVIIVDDLIPQSANLVAGANEDGYHLKNVNYGRDYTADTIADVALARAGDGCPECNGTLVPLKADLVAESKNGQLVFHDIEMLQAIAETHHDEHGLVWPPEIAPYDVHLVWLPGRKMDTRPAADELYESLQAAGLSVLYDDRDERAGVKFNDADLIGCPVRVTVGERGLKDGMVELKARTASERELAPLDKIVARVIEKQVVRNE
ncbi:MAG: hypothetical protein GXP40_03140 [Chloroflexi bacterium]|nr:hypothetical protein [Chloroflexota bacterium]